MEAIDFAKEILKIDGKFVAKIFMGSLFNDILLKAKKTFKKVNIYIPPASRKNSKVSFIICKFLS